VTCNDRGNHVRDGAKPYLSRGLLLLAAPIGAMIVCICGGCSNKAGAADATPAKKESAFTSITAVKMDLARTEAMAAADTYTTIIAQAADELRQRTKREEVVDWALQQRIATATACFTNATGTNGFVGLLDMLVYTRLKREAMDRHWIPTLLRDEGQPMLDAHLRGEKAVWEAGARVLSQAQLAELGDVIQQWLEENPTQYYVSHIRFTDFANSIRGGAKSSQLKMPTSVFGLLYVDPLAGLDPVAKELQEYRGLTERLVFMFNRMPMVLSWQVELASRHMTRGPEIQRFVDDTGRIADSTARFTEATTRFADTVVRLPQHLTSERTAAIEQLNVATTQQVKSALDQTFAGIAEQRQAMMRDIDAQQSSVRAIVGDVRGIVERADEAGKSLNTATSQTINNTEQSARRTITHAAVLVGLLIVGSLLALLLYRIALKRWVLQPETPSQRAA
jgi:hypothetical protein